MAACVFPWLLILIISGVACGYTLCANHILKLVYTTYYSSLFILTKCLPILIISAVACGACILYVKHILKLVYITIHHDLFILTKFCFCAYHIGYFQCHYC